MLVQRPLLSSRGECRQLSRLMGMPSTFCVSRRVHRLLKSELRYAARSPRVPSLYRKIQKLFCLPTVTFYSPANLVDLKIATLNSTVVQLSPTSLLALPHHLNGRIWGYGDRRCCPPPWNAAIRQCIDQAGALHHHLTTAAKSKEDKERNSQSCYVSFSPTCIVPGST